MVYESLIYDDTSMYEARNDSASHSVSSSITGSMSESSDADSEYNPRHAMVGDLQHGQHVPIIDTSSMSESSDADSEYNPRHAMVGDLQHGQHVPIIDSLLNGCLNMLDQKYSSFPDGIAESTIGFPSIDCDAFSFIITADPSGSDFTLNIEQKKAIKRFLCTFAQPLSTVSFPMSEVAANKTDSMFGSSKNQCQHVQSITCGDLLVSNESLVISAPVKLAVHNSCREKLIKFLNKNQGLPANVELSPNPNICIHPSSCGNLPCYELVTEAILSSCYVADKNKFVIHVANLGTRYPIQASEDENNPCQIRKLFVEVDRLRQSGIVVETTQLDVAFNYRFRDKLLQWSHTKNKSIKKIPSVFSKCQTEKWAIHDVKCSVQNDMMKCIPSQQKGTVRLKHKDWKKCQYSKLSDHYHQYSDSDDDSDESESLEFNQFWSDLLQAKFHGTRINHCSIHSVKMYSTISHSMRKIQNIMPMTLSQMTNLHRCTFKKLQLMLNSMQVMFNKAAVGIQEDGICSRLEVSIRPGVDELGQDLRLRGSLTDLLIHVHVAVNDLFFQDRDISLHHISIDPVRSKLISLVEGLEPYLRFRHSLRFCDIHSQEKEHQWLQSLINMIMLTGGLASNFNLKYFSRWLTDSGRHDPTGQAKLICSNFLNIHSDTEVAVVSTKPTIPQSIIREVASVLSSVGISTAGSTTVLEFIQEQDTTSCFERFSLKDLLILADSCHDIKTLIISQKNQKNQYVQDTETTPLTGTIGGDRLLINQIKEIDSSIFDYQRPRLFESSSLMDSTLKLTQGRSHQHSRLNRSNKWPEDPYLTVVILFEQLTQPFNLHDPFFIHRLYHHICLCHNQSLLLRNQEPLLPFSHHPSQPTTSFTVAARILKNFNSSNKDLLDLCHGLKVPVFANARTRSALISKLAIHYFFPCQVGTPDLDSYQLLLRGVGNELRQSILSSLQEDFVLKLNYYNTRQHHYYRSENLHLFIISGENLVSRAYEEYDIHEQSSDLYYIIDHCFIPQSLSGNDCRQVIRNHLLRLKKISQHFLTDFAVPNIFFQMAQSVEQLQQSNNFSLLPTATGTLQPFSTYCPEVIFPAASLAFMANIFFRDHVTSLSYLHVYMHSCHKVITYQFEDVAVSPKIDCHCFVRTADNIYQRVHTESHQEYDVFSYVNDFSLDHCKITKTLKTHPSGNPIGTPTFSQAIISLLRSDEVAHPHFSEDEETFQADDPFYLYDFLGELSYFYANEELSLFFSTDIVQLWDELQSNLENINDLAQHIFNEGFLDTMHHSFLCSLLCLKYKLWFAIWENRDKTLSTYFYAYNSQRNVVEMHVCENYVYKERDIMYLYLKHTSHNGRISTGYWKAADYNPFTGGQSTFNSAMLLRTPYSYLDGPEFTNLLKLMVERIGMNINLSKEIRHPVTQGFSHPSLLIRRILVDEILTDHLLAVFYPADPPNHGRCTVMFISSASCDGIQRSIQSVMQSIGHEHSHNYDVRSLHITNKCYFSSLFVLSIYMYTAHICPDPNILQTAILSLQQQVDLVKRVKVWISHVLTNVTEVTIPPHWLSDLTERN